MNSKPSKPIQTALLLRWRAAAPSVTRGIVSRADRSAKAFDATLNRFAAVSKATQMKALQPVLRTGNGH
jgi:hypothetical protein